MTVATRSAVTDYAERVLTARIVTGRLVRLACERHLADLKRSDLWFDPDAADAAIEFFDFLPHSKGEWAGTPFELAPWQKFIVGSLFGWKNLDGSRRFRVSFVEVARKNGKTTLASGVALLLAFFDDEPGAEVYALATKGEQAKIVWGEGKAMVLGSPFLKARVTVLANNLHQESTRSKFQWVASEADTLDGLNPNGVIIDELHAHKTRALWDVMQTATGARRQPLIFAITTAGFDRASVCWEQAVYAQKVLEGSVTDDTFFCYIATIDEGDEWTDPTAWVKANPNLGVSVKIEDLRRKCEKAKQVPGEVNAFLQLHLDVWTTQSVRWLSDEMWAAQQPTALEDLKGRLCYAGLEASSTYDIAALTLWFPDDDGAGGSVIPFFWAPQEAIEKRSREDNVPYDTWANDGHLVATEGNVLDYDAIRAKLNDLFLEYDIREVATKRWNVTQLQSQLIGDGFDVVQYSDGYSGMSEPTKELERLLIEGKVRHGNGPILRWMASNVAVRRDAEEHIRPDKAASTEDITGIVALIMAIGRGMLQDNSSAGVFFAS